MSDPTLKTGADSLTPANEGRPPTEGETHDTDPHRALLAIGIEAVRQSIAVGNAPGRDARRGIAPLPSRPP